MLAAGSFCGACDDMGITNNRVDTTITITDCTTGIPLIVMVQSVLKRKSQVLSGFLNLTNHK